MVVILPDNELNYVPYILIFIVFPVVPIIVNYMRHTPKNTASGVGTQHILLIGMFIQMLFIGSGVGLLLAIHWN